MLWLALHFPLLPLENPSRGCPRDTPCAIADRSRILFCNDAARHLGVRSGMKRTAAEARSPGIQLLEANPEQEARALRGLADWSLQFSSLVSMEPPDGLLLEIGGSLKLFGGLPRLRRRITHGLDELGYGVATAVASTPRGAWLLARAGDSSPVIDRAELRQRLGRLPWQLLELTPEQEQALQGLGLKTLADCLTLPRGELNRRLGRSLTRQLEQALGEQPEPRHPHQAPRRYQGRLELPAPAPDSPSLLFALQYLLRELCGLLRGIDSGVEQFSLQLEHERHPPTVLRMGVLEPSRHPQRLLAVCREGLERRPLPAEVHALELLAERILPLPGRSGTLFDDPFDSPAEPWRELAERLLARLGEDSVRSLGTHADHRPENAWSSPPAGNAVQQQANPYRPLWLLRTPRPLEQYQGRPCWNGPLALHQGPERLESGWWDGHDLARDYYTARAPNGSLVWIYRERRPPRGWFLHGFFA